MYLTNDTYKEKVKELDRVWESRVDIEHEKGTLHLTDKDIALGGMSVTEKTQPGEDFTVGGTVASDLSLKIWNRTGGGNLTKNSDFSQGLKYWNNWGIANREIITDEQGKNWVHIWQDDEELFRGVIQEQIPFMRDTDVTVSFTAYKVEDLSGGVRVLFHTYGGGDLTPQPTRTFNVTGKPERYSFTFKSSDRTDKDYFRLMIGGESGKPFDIYITDIKFEIGEQATPWEDDYSDIDFTGAKIKPYVMLTEDDERRNLIRNSDFRNDLIGWKTWANKGIVTKTNPNAYRIHREPEETYTIGFENTIDFKIEKDKKYTLSFKGSGYYGGALYDYIYILSRKKGNKILNHNNLMDLGKTDTSVLGTDNYANQYSLTFSLKEDIEDARILIGSTIPEPSEYPTGFYLTDVILTEGEYYVDWRPAVEDWSEPIPLGIFNVDTQSRFRSTIELKAMDNMIKLDRSYSHSKLSYPATLYQIYVDVCSTCNLLPATHNFLHKDLLIKNRPEGDFSCRDILGFVAQLSGSFAKITRDGKVALKWYEPAGLELGPMNRDDFKPSDEQIAITGVMFKESDEKTYLTGTDDYAIDLTENPLLQQDYSKVLPAILNKIKEIKFNPYTVSKWQGNPAIEAGDMVRHIDVDGNIFDTIITSSTYRYGMKGSMEAKAKSEINKGYKGSTSKKIANVVQKIENNRIEVEDKLTSVEQAQLNAMELLSNMLGGHLIIDEENATIYIANNSDLDKATEWWQWGIGGFAHFKDGVPDTSITADGSIVAMLVAAHIITADMVRTGILQAEDGNTWINLNNSQFNFANMITWDGKEFKINFNKAGLAVGVANLVRRSKDRKVSSSYLVGTYDMTEDWELNTTYSIAIKGNINSGQEFGIWANGAGTQVTTLKYDKSDELYKATFTTPSSINSQEPKTLRVYNYPSSGAQNAAIDWIKLEKGSVNTGWTFAEGELEGASYSFTGDAAILKGAGFIILNNNSVPVMQGDAQGNLSMTGDFITYNNGQKALEMANNELRLYDWQGTTRVDPVGQLYAARRGYDANKPGFSIANRKNAYLALTYRKDSVYYAYIDFDKDNVLGNSKDYPIVFWERPLFRNPARFDSTVYFGGQRHKIFNATKGALVIEVNDGDTTRGFTLQGDTQNSKVLEFRPWWKEEIALWRNTLISGNLSVTGSKNSLQETKHYGQRLLNALETAEYYFADFGFGKIGEDGKCYIYIDDIFNETVNTEVEYHVIYGKYGENENSKIITKERHKNYFVAKGTPGLEFSWFLVVKRKGYEHNRLEQPDNLNLERDDSVSFDRDFEQEDKEDKELERIYDDKLSFDLVSLLLEEAV